MTYTSVQTTTPRFIHDPRMDPEPQTLGGSRRLRGHFEVLASMFKVGERAWKVTGVYAPSKAQDQTGKGLRLLLTDQKAFHAFLTQADYEVLFGLVPGKTYVPWYGGPYPAGADQEGWTGPYMDEGGLADLLLDYETVLRADLEKQRVVSCPQGEVACFRVHLGFRGKENKDYQFAYELQERLLTDERLGLENITTRWKRQEAPGTVPLVWGQV